MHYVYFKFIFILKHIMNFLIKFTKGKISKQIPWMKNENGHFHKFDSSWDYFEPISSKNLEKFTHYVFDDYLAFSKNPNPDITQCKIFNSKICDGGGKGLKLKMYDEKINEVYQNIFKKEEMTSAVESKKRKKYYHDYAYIGLLKTVDQKNYHFQKVIGNDGKIYKENIIETFKNQKKGGPHNR